MSLPPRAKSLLRAAAPLHEPSKVDEARVLASLAEKVAAAGSLAAGSGAPAAGAVATTKAAWVKLAIKIAAVAFVGPASVGVYLALGPAPHAIPAVAAPSIVLSPSVPTANAPASIAPTVESEIAPEAQTKANAPASPPAALPSRPATAVRPGVQSATELQLGNPGGDSPPAEALVPPQPTAAAVAVAPSEPAANTAQSTALPAAPTAHDGPAPLAARPSDGPRASSDRGESGTRDGAPPTTQTAAAGLAEELALLRQAEQALRAGDSARALASLDEHARRFPTGSLAEERTVSRILALCAAGRTEEAGSLARTFVSSRPHSPHLPRVRASCGISGPK